MKRFMSLLAAVSLVISSVLWFGLPQPARAAGLNDVVTFRTLPVLAEEIRNAAEAKLSNPFGEKIDINNANVRAFIQFPGMYPNIAGKVVRNAPYEDVKEIFDIPGLSDREKEIIQMHIDKLIATDPETALVEGGDRFNNGIYK